jgi:hypothetical protein
MGHCKMLEICNNYVKSHFLPIKYNTTTSLKVNDLVLCDHSTQSYASTILKHKLVMMLFRLHQAVLHQGSAENGSPSTLSGAKCLFCR